MQPDIVNLAAAHLRQAMDPALIDRTTNPIIGISDRDQPVRPMTISGIEQSIQAKILSTNTRGTGTRMVRLDPGWGSGLAGAFTADVEVFVLKGTLFVGSAELTEYSYAAIPAGGVVGGFRAPSGAIALLMTSGPIRYDTSTGGAPARLVVAGPSGTAWSRDEDDRDVFMSPLAVSESSQVWYGSTDRSGDEVSWHRHPHDEETFVLEGEVEYLDSVEGQTVKTVASPGSYFYRSAGIRHTVSKRIGDETVLTFHRSLGSHETETLDSEDPPT